MHIKGTFPLAFLVSFCSMNNFEELQPLPLMEFSFNTLPRQFSIASLLKLDSILQKLALSRQIVAELGKTHEHEG